MRIIDPATDQVLEELNEDSAQTVREKAARARQAQPAWAARPLEGRVGVLRRFRDLVVERQATLAETLTAEVGKPITQSNNELNGLLARMDFFLEHVTGELAPELVQRSADLEERISHEPLGVLANISAWNYPYFVGSNVFVPALLT